MISTLISAFSASSRLKTFPDCPSTPSIATVIYGFTDEFSISSGLRLLSAAASAVKGADETENVRAVSADKIF